MSDTVTYGIAEAHAMTNHGPFTKQLDRAKRDSTALFRLNLRGKSQHAGKAPVGLSIACCALAGYAVWAQGGTLPALQPPLLLLGAWVFAALLFHLRGRTGRVLCRDPFFWFGLLFLLLLVVQTWNAGRTLYFHPFEERWMFTPPPVPYLPWSFDRSESLQMLYWFAPAWVLALALRHAPGRGRLGRALFYFVAVNGVLFALAGIVQSVHGTPFLFWHTRPLTDYFFATLYYRNHAGAYLTLALAATLGLLRYEIRWRRSAQSPLNTPVIWVLGAATVVLVVALHAALSRAGIVLCWMLITLFIGSLIAEADKIHGPARRLQAAAVVVMVLLMASTWAIILGGDVLERRAQSLHAWASVLEGRQWQRDTAVWMWQDHKVWGVGGWGYRHLLPFYVDESYARHARWPGKANVHNDYLQFLVEFGAVGFLLLLGTAAALVAGFIRAWKAVWGRPVSGLYLFVMAGPLLVAVHAVIDLPFRNPAVLYTWVILLTAIPAGWRPETLVPAKR